MAGRREENKEMGREGDGDGLNVGHPWLRAHPVAARHRRDLIGVERRQCGARDLGIFSSSIVVLGLAGGNVGPSSVDRKIRRKVITRGKRKEEMKKTKAVVSFGG